MKRITKFKISKFFAILFLVSWQLETWFFIFRDGWHWKAISEAEKTCDGIVSVFLIISFGFFFSILFDLVKFFAYANITSITISDKFSDDAS